MATSKRPLGRSVRCPEGYVAFIPDPLPPKLDWSARLVSALSEADRLIGRLAGEGGKLPNRHMLMRPFLAREAVLSSRIEGTQATLGELLASQAGAAVERSPEELREVGTFSGFGAWFKAQLSENIVLDTAPWAPSTCWGQAYFAVRDQVDVSKGDLVHLSFSAVVPEGRDRPCYVWAGRVARGPQTVSSFEETNGLGRSNAEHQRDAAGTGTRA